MALIKSISGIRGTIGGVPNENLTPLDVVKFAAAYGSWVLEKGKGKKIVVGRDGRISGEMVQQLVVNTLLAMGLDVVDLGLSTTPTVELAVTWEQAGGGIIITASHNPPEWNALKFIGADGTFLGPGLAREMLDIYHQGEYAKVSGNEMRGVETWPGQPTFISKRFSNALVHCIPNDDFEWYWTHVMVPDQ